MKYKWKIHPTGMCIPGYNIRSVMVRNMIECQMECEKTPMCLSVDYLPPDNQCYLNSLNSASSVFKSCLPTKFINADYTKP